MSTCPAEHSNTNLVIGILLISGSIISFIPQYYKIITRKSVSGISHWTQGLTNMSSFCAFFGSFMLDYYLFSCCKDNGGCGYLMMPFIQLLFSWLCPFINYLIYMKYFKSTNISKRRAVYGFFIFYVIVFLISFALTCIVLAARWYSWQNHAILFGNILNILSAIITAFVWIPQIIETYKTKDIGALSLISLAIQTPGSFIIFIFQVFLAKSSWYIGIPYLVTSIFQLVVLVMGIIYNKRNKKKQVLTHEHYNNQVYVDYLDSYYIDSNDNIDSHDNIEQNALLNNNATIYYGTHMTDDLTL